MSVSVERGILKDKLLGVISNQVRFWPDIVSLELKPNLTQIVNKFRISAEESLWHGQGIHFTSKRHYEWGSGGPVLYIYWLLNILLTYQIVSNSTDHKYILIEYLFKLNPK